MDRRRGPAPGGHDPIDLIVAGLSAAAGVEGMVHPTDIQGR
jgi:hypothetical protein